VRKAIFICGAGLLCLGSWIDNVRGPMLPALTQFMSMDQQSAGFMMSLGNFVAMLSTWLLMPLLNRWSLRRIGAIVLIYTVFVTMGSLLVKDQLTLFVWGAFIGGSISTLGSLSNLFVQSGVAPEKRGQMMSILHSLYGLSSFFAPWVAGKILNRPENWQLLFISAAPLALVLAGVVIRYGGADTPETRGKPAAQPMTLNMSHILTILVLVAYVLGEVLTSTWMTSFLTSEAGFSITDASNYTSAFFASMLITRILCGAFARPRYHRIILWMSLSLSLCCFVIGRLTGWYWLLPLTGLFGPFFPLYVTWASLRFPERDRALVIWMLSGMQAALCVMNTVVGRVADAYGFKIAYWIPALMIISAMILLRATARLTSDSPRDNSNH